jgi:hypothetical protein
MMNDGSGNLFWGSGSNIQSTLRRQIRSSGTSDITLNSEDSFVICNNTGATINVNLPSAVGLIGKEYIVKRVSPTGAGNDITILPDGAETIDGNASIILLNQYETITILSDGSNWLIRASSGI